MDRTKTCSKCKQEKPLSEFYWIKSRKSYGWYCKSCNNSRPKGSKHYQKHLDTVRKNAKRRAKERQQQAIEYLGGKCTCCGKAWPHPCDYDFHHKDGSKKEQTISRLLHSAATWSRIVEELDKCVLVDAICHRRIHAGVTQLVEP